MIRGSIAAIVTPTNAAGEVDERRLARLIDLHLQAGSDALLLPGTTGDRATLDLDAHCRLIRRVVALVQGEMPVIASIGSNSTREAIAFSLAAKQAGADALMLSTPCFPRRSQQELYGHFESIARAVDMPQMLHDRTGGELSVATVARLSAVANIIGINDASGDLQRARQLLARCAPGFALYAGDDRSALEVMLLGGAGRISLIANLAPRLVADLCAALRRGDARTALQLDSRLRAVPGAGQAKQSAGGPGQPIHQPCSPNPLARADAGDLLGVMP